MALGGVGYFATGYFHTQYWHTDYWSDGDVAAPVAVLLRRIAFSGRRRRRTTTG